MDMNMGYGFWPAAVLMIVAASWILYRYVAPRGWKEWQGAGLVQAFIIALYAEMYGFPLTLYALTGFFGIDIPILHMSGHLWSTLLGYGYVGGVIESFIGYAFVLFGIGLLAEGWREVYQARKEERLATDKLYGLVRHPQYTGIFIALFGQLIHWPTVITLALFPVITWFYVRLAHREEEHMTQQFGAAYERYRQHVPAFFPKWGTWGDLFDEIRPLSLGRSPQERSGENQHNLVREDSREMHKGSKSEDYEPVYQEEKENGTAGEAEHDAVPPFGGVRER